MPPANGPPSESAQNRITADTNETGCTRASGTGVSRSLIKSPRQNSGKGEPPCSSTSPWYPALSQGARHREKYEYYSRSFPARAGSNPAGSASETRDPTAFPSPTTITACEVVAPRLKEPSTLVAKARRKKSRAAQVS
jgi:hypothetical protein